MQPFVSGSGWWDGRGTVWGAGGIPANILVEQESRRCAQRLNQGMAKGTASGGDGAQRRVLGGESGRAAPRSWKAGGDQRHIRSGTFHRAPAKSHLRLQG